MRMKRGNCFCENYWKRLDRLEVSTFSRGFIYGARYTSRFIEVLLMGSEGGGQKCGHTQAALIHRGSAGNDGRNIWLADLHGRI